MTSEESIVIEPRFQGIPQVALGGYVGGRLARDLAEAEALFRRPVPVGRPLRVEARGSGETALLDGPELLAKVGPARVDIRLPDVVTREESEVAQRAYPGYVRHLFPHCFTCGPARSEEDGLRIFPGPVAGREVVACLWTPRRTLATDGAEVAREYIWSALDCPSIWALVEPEPSDSSERVVSGRLAVRQTAPVVPGEPHLVMAWPMDREGRARVGGATILSPDGEICAVARHTLVAADWGVPLSIARWK
jgi:hypothetical protein